MFKGSRFFLMFSVHFFLLDLVFSCTARVKSVNFSVLEQHSNYADTERWFHYLAPSIIHVWKSSCLSLPTSSFLSFVSASRESSRLITASCAVLVLLSGTKVAVKQCFASSHDTFVSSESCPCPAGCRVFIASLQWTCASVSFSCQVERKAARF